MSTDPGNAGDGGNPQTVPYERFATVVSQKNEMASQLDALRQENQGLAEKAATVDTLSSQVNEWRGKAEQAETRYGRWQNIASKLGTTDQEAVEAAEWAYGRLPEADRPEMGAWLDTIKADSAKAPKVLRPWLTGDSAGGQGDAGGGAGGAGGGQQPPPKNPPRGNQPPGAPANVSAEQFRAAKEHAIRTGDWSRYQALAKSAGMRTNVPG